MDAILAKQWTPPLLEKTVHTQYVQGLFDWCAPLRKDWLPTSEAARYLGYSPATVLRLCEDAQLESRIFGTKSTREERLISRRSVLLRFATEAQVAPKEHIELFWKWLEAVKCPHLLRLLQQQMPGRIAAVLERAGA
jgi:hypothetical protein